MKSISATFCIIFFSLLLFVGLSCARKDAGDYWKNMVENQRVPEAIKDLLVQDSASQLSEAENKKDRFDRDFDIKPNVIIYHSHDVSEKTKPSVKHSP
ncbi:organ-specific protein P4-like [Prosopis cineraria]|uniref:organ-specific protein P4-like n=1 Tax=Prosopis cineraria TaxID=364024 RepID=UPI00240F4368|nr:organ-specific protein P4-like [Prosopis cineraria]